MSSTSKGLVKLLQEGVKSPGALVERLDAWINTFNGIGSSVRDASTAMVNVRTKVLEPELALQLFHNDDLANRIVSAVPDDAMREGFTVKRDAEDGEDIQEEVKAIMDRARELELGDKVREALIWGRCTGGAAIILMVDGAGLPSDPLEDDKVKKLAGLEVVDRTSLQVRSWYAEGPKLGHPETYYLNMLSEGGPQTSNQVIHETRLIMFRGALTSRQERNSNNGWDHSVLQRVYEILKNTNGAWLSVMHMMQDFSQAVYKIKGLIDAVAEDEESKIQKRMALVDMVRSVTRAIVLDSEDEDFKIVERGAITGIDGLIDKIFLRLSSAARMPVAILLGQSPAGLNATGSIDLRWYYDTVRTCQMHEAKPRIERVVRIIARERQPGTDPKSWEADFPSLWQMSPAEEAELRNKIALTDVAYIGAGVVLPEEVSLSRWGSGAYSTEMSIDLDARKSMLDAEIAKAEEKAGQPDPLPPAPNAQPDPNTPAPKQGPDNGKAPETK